MNAQQAYSQVDQFGVGFTFNNPSERSKVEKGTEFTGAKIHVRYLGTQGTKSFELKSREEAAFAVLVLSQNNMVEDWYLSQVNNLKK